MPEPVNINKAELREIKPDGTEERSSRLVVQFNPESLKVAFANQIVPPQNNSKGAGDQRGGSTTQFVGKGTTKLTVQLWFDVTSVLPKQNEATKDVRELTKKVAYFITPKPSQNNPDMYVPPAIRFLWGTFQFDGIVEGMDETLEMFSPTGVPLRASVQLSMSQQEIQFTIARPKNSQPSSGAGKTPSGAAPGTRELTQAKSGSTLQGMAADKGKQGDWKAIAKANNIENPRKLKPGQMIDMNVKPTPKTAAKPAAAPRAIPGGTGPRAKPALPASTASRTGRR